MPKIPKFSSKLPNPADDLPFSHEVGPTLRARRLKLEITIDEIAHETKIHKTYIKAIEESDFRRLPHSVQTVGFIKRYARLLGLDEKTAAQKYLLQRGPIEQSKSPAKTRVKPPIVGSKLAGWLAIAGVLALTTGYLIWQLIILASPPRLVIERPLDNQQVSEQTVDVIGQTSPGVEVKIDGQVIYVDDDGRFTTSVHLNPGLNVIKIDAVNRKQQASGQEISIYYSQ